MPARDEEIRDRNKTLELESLMRKMLDEQRKMSNELYAQKMVERVVYGLVGILLTAVVVAIVAQVLK